MQFSILGPVEGVAGGGQLALGGPRQRALLAYLLVHANRAVSADSLVEELWATPPRDAHAALQNQVSRLRKVLGDRLVTQPPGYLIRVEEGELDLDRFRSLVAAAGSAHDPHERSRLLREADALFRGAPFAGMDAPFVAAEAAGLEELRVAAIEARVDADLERGRHAELVPELAALVARQPLRERLRAQQILALYRCGRQAEALEAYRATWQMLDEELGLEPSPALRELERAILRHDPTLAQERLDDEPAVAAVPARRRSRRRLALVGVAAVALTAAGAGSAMLLLHRPVPVRTAAAVHRRRVVAPVAHVVHRRTATPRREPVKRAVPRPPHTATVVHVAVPPVTHAATTTVAHTPPPSKPAAPPPPATSTQSRPPANVTPTVTTETVASPPANWKELSDSFDGTMPNWALWKTNVTGTDTAYAQQNGRLELALSADGETGGQYDMIQTGFASQCTFPGDFDARVDYTLLAWPAQSGARLQISAWTLPTGGVDVARTSSSYQESYAGDLEGRWQSFPSGDQHGTLRVTRHDGTLASYYLLKGKWVMLIAGPSNHVVTIGLQLFAMHNDWAHETVRAAFDNFSIAAPQIDCS